MEEVTLNLPGRDAKIEEYKRYIRNLGKAGIHYTTYAHMGNGIWSTEREATRGGASARAFDLAKARRRPLERQDLPGPADPRPRATPRRRSGTTTPTSSGRWRRWPRRRAC